MRKILWGVHKSHGDKPLKLCEFSVSAQNEREREGWITRALEPGEWPADLVVIAASWGGTR